MYVSASRDHLDGWFHTAASKYVIAGNPAYVVRRDDVLAAGKLHGFDLSTWPAVDVLAKMKRTEKTERGWEKAETTATSVTGETKNAAAVYTMGGDAGRSLSSCDMSKYPGHVPSGGCTCKSTWSYGGKTYCGRQVRACRQA